jgi:inosine/xanthosine triphosphatase
MINVCVASQNPVKVECAKNSFISAFPKEDFTFSGVDIPSNVSNQPMTDQETLLGADNRAKNAQISFPNADYWVGIEGGVEIKDSEMNAFAWVVILSSDKKGKSKTATFYLPEAISTLVKDGVEMGYADDQVFKRSNSKQKNGAIGILTHGLIGRTAYYESAITMALIPFMNPELY